MDKPKIYLETTMFSFYYKERTAPLYRAIGIYKPAEVLEIYEDSRRLPERSQNSQ